jgi:chromosome segregation ATPase
MSYYEDRIKALESRIEEMAMLNRMKAVPVEAKLMDRIGELNAENARLKAAGDTLVAAYCMGDRNKERWAEYPVVREWLAAKGELP